MGAEGPLHSVSAPDPCTVQGHGNCPNCPVLQPQEPDTGLAHARFQGQHALWSTLCGCPVSTEGSSAWQRNEADGPEAAEEGSAPKRGTGQREGDQNLLPCADTVITYLSRATMSQVFLSKGFTWGSRSLARGAEGTGWDRQNERSKEMAGLSLRCA